MVRTNPADLGRGRKRPLSCPFDCCDTARPSSSFRVVFVPLVAQVWPKPQPRTGPRVDQFHCTTNQLCRRNSALEHPFPKPFERASATRTDGWKGTLTWVYAFAPFCIVLHHFSPLAAQVRPKRDPTALQSAGGANPIRDSTASGSATQSRRGLFERAQIRSTQGGDSHRHTQSVGGGGMSPPCAT